MTDRIGLLGTGNIGCAVVEGLMSAPGPTPQVLVSPRNAAKAAGLAQRFGPVRVAAENQAVLDGSDTIVLALRPDAATDALRPLRFRPDHAVVSLIPLPVASVTPLVTPASVLIRALPLPTCARRLQAIPYWPAHAGVHDLLSRLGTPLAVSTEHALNVLWASTAMIAPFYALLERVARWSAAHGVEVSNAADYTASTFHALASLALTGEPQRFAGLAAEASTPGGLNQQVVSALEAGGVYDRIAAALDAVLARIEAAPRPGPRQLG